MSVTVNNKDVALSRSKDAQYTGFTDKTAVKFAALPTKFARGGVVVKALRYKPAGRGFDSRWCQWNFSAT